MISPYAANAFWDDRVQGSTAVAEHLLDFLARLADIDPGLAPVWVDTSDFDSGPAELSLEVLVASLERSRVNDNGSINPERVGVNIGLSAEDGSGLSVSARCGGGSQRGGNSIVVRLPDRAHMRPGQERLLDPDVAYALVRALIASWQPRYAGWHDRRLYDNQGVEAKEVRVGWLTYVSNDGADLDRDRIPSGVVGEDLDDGVLIRIGDDPLAVPVEGVLGVRAAFGYGPPNPDYDPALPPWKQKGPRLLPLPPKSARM